MMPVLRQVADVTNWGEITSAMQATSGRAWGLYALNRPFFN